MLNRINAGAQKVGLGNILQDLETMLLSHDKDLGVFKIEAPEEKASGESATDLLKVELGEITKTIANLKTEIKDLKKEDKKIRLMISARKPKSKRIDKKDIGVPEDASTAS